MRVRGFTTAVVAAVLALGGCAADDGGGGRGPTGAPSPVTTTPTDPPCGSKELVDKQAGFPNAAGTTVFAYVLGTGTTAVVLAPQAAQKSCGWLSYAQELAARGYRVLAFDFTGEGRSGRGAGTPSGDVVAAVGHLRAQGATRVVLMGASRGGTAALTAAATVTPPVDAIVSMSAPAVYAGESALAAAPKLTMPVLYLAAQGEASFRDEAQLLHDATPAGRRTVTIVPGSLHGSGFVLIAAEGATEARAAIDAFLAAHAPVRR